MHLYNSPYDFFAKFVQEILDYFNDQNNIVPDLEIRYENEELKWFDVLVTQLSTRSNNQRI